MSDAVGAVVAAIAAGVFGIVGTFAGIYVGRRQTTDQAQVEHGQWLRGQRQEAYVQFLNAWEEALTQCREYRKEAEEFWHLMTEQIPHFEGAGEEAMLESVTTSMEQALAKVQPLLERVQILGPTRVERAAAELNTTLVNMQKELLLNVPGNGPAGTSLEEFDRASSWALEQRQMFVKASRDVMRAAPRPGEG
ncbi:hypothetical protein ACWC4A_52965 [Streptomyces mirabilis]